MKIRLILALLPSLLALQGVAQVPPIPRNHPRAVTVQPSEKELAALQLASKDVTIAQISMQLQVEHVLAQHPGWQFDPKQGSFFVMQPDPAANEAAPTPSPSSVPAKK